MEIQSTITVPTLPRRLKASSVPVATSFVPERILQSVNTVHSKHDAPGEIDLGLEGRLLQEFLQFDGLTKQIIDAYDYWIDVTLKRRISCTVIQFSLGTIKFEDIKIMSPTMILPGTQTRVKQFPHNARRDKTTYALSVYVTMKFYPKGSDVSTQEENFKLGELPVILGSKHCNLYGLSGKTMIAKGECDKDPLGYFIIEGQEKIVLQHDKLRYNKPFIFPKDNKKPDCGMFEESVNLNSKKRELSGIICRFTALPTMDYPFLQETKEFSNPGEIDPKKSTVVNLYYDLRTKALLIKLDKFIPDTYLNIFYLYELYGIEDVETSKKMILNYVPEKFRTKIMTFLNRGETDYRLKQDIISVLKGVMKLPEKVEKMSTQKQIEFYQERLSEVFFKQTEGPIYQNNQEKYRAKLEMLSIMAARYAQFQTNCRDVDQRDSWSNKRVVSAGPAMEHLFNQIWNSMINELMNQYLINVTVNERSFEIGAVHARLPSNLIKDTFVRSFNPNTWGAQQSIMKENMTDFLKNETLLAKYSQILKISPETSDKGKQTSIREVNFTQTGYICSIETPEGKQCGIVKGLAVGCYISIGRDESVIIQYVKQQKMITNVQDEFHDCAFILNGKFIGWCQGKDCEQELKKARRNVKIHRDSMIHFESPRILWVYCDGGRPTRPLLVVNQSTGKLVIDEKNMWQSGFYDLLKEGAVEYIDALEQEFSCVVAQSIWDEVFGLKMNHSNYISVTSQRDPTSYSTFREIVNKPKYTHCEMDPNSILSLVASIIPMPDRSQAPRNTYQTSMGKQALSIQNTNAINRFDTEVKSLAYPSPTLFETQMYKYIGLDELPIGETVMVAMMAYGGWNQEDSIIINQAAVDRGRFRIVRTITYKTVQISGNKGFVENIQRPIKKVSNAESLDEDGVILPGTYVRQGDCLIGKVKKILGSREVLDASVYVGVGDSGIVERVLKTSSADSRKIVMVKIREVRKPRAGDKCACVPEETEILTKNRGWISMKDVKTTDLVASLDNEKLVYVHPEAIHEYDYEGDMYSLTSNQVELLVTPNHNLYVKTMNDFELVRADKVFGTSVYHKKNAIFTDEEEMTKCRNQLNQLFQNSNIFITTNRTLVNQIQISAAHAGWCVDAKNTEEDSIYLELNREERNQPQITKSNAKEKWVPYSGKVYCCTVPSGVIYIRHNMKPVWCGNSRYAQKGTIGIVMPTESMPVVMTGPNAGMIPDIIINPHCIPSRMTVGKMIEIMVSKVGAMLGKKVNATAFRDFDLDAYSRELSKLGFDKYGSETMMNGMTGEMFENQVFLGPCYYQALKHHVQDKIQQRGRGPVKITTRQPTAGRTKGGGIRFGEMERDAVLSHGATSCQKEKTFDHSDPYKTLFCKNCGTIANIKKVNLKNPCQKCSKFDFGLVSVPYSYKVLVHELCAASMQINLKLREKSKTIM